MRKFCFSIVVASMILLMVSYSFAYSGTRNAISSDGKTAFANISVTGLNKDRDTTLTDDMGLPGYIEFINPDNETYYLWVDRDGLLRISSDVVVGYLASPATVGWKGSASGTVVGRQTSDGT